MWSVFQVSKQSLKLMRWLSEDRGVYLDGDAAHRAVKGHSPQFSAHVRCGQTAGWTEMPLGMEVSLGPGDFVRWGPSSPQKKGHTYPHPISGPRLLC